MVNILCKLGFHTPKNEWVKYIEPGRDIEVRYGAVCKRCNKTIERINVSPDFDKTHNIIRVIDYSE